MTTMLKLSITYFHDRISITKIFNEVNIILNNFIFIAIALKVNKIKYILIEYTNLTRTT